MKFVLKWAVRLAVMSYAASSPAATVLGSPAASTPPIPTSEAILPSSVPGFAETAEAHSYLNTCARVRIKKTKGVSLSEMEKRLLCGDTEKSPIGLPWATIPPSEAAYFLRGFLQTRGYHQPRFVEDTGILFVDPGTESELTGFRLSGGPSSWDPPRRRLIAGQPLTPALLDDLEKWSLMQIKNEGYACATTTSQADPLSGQSEVFLQPGQVKIIRSILDKGDGGLNTGVLDRYNAFRIGDIYRDFEIELTKTRTQNDGILQGLVLSAKCDSIDRQRPEDLTIVRDILLGPSRTISVGVGGSTEEGATLQSTIQRNRIGASASTAQAKIVLSYLNPIVNHQLANARYRWYYSPDSVRSYIEPSIAFEHTAEEAYDLQTMETKVLYGWTHEFGDGQLELRTGPTNAFSDLFRGTGPTNQSLFYIENTARWTSHAFEYNATSPRDGANLLTTFLLTQREWGANFTAQKLEVQGEKLWSIARFDPPFLILAVRFDLNTVFSPDQNISTALPLKFLTFLGGDKDLRGYERQSLPRSGAGALGGLTGSFEARLHKILFRRADIFTFVDSGMLGLANLEYRSPVFTSPGLGVRWESPIGVLRVYAAERFAMNQQPGDLPYDQAWRVGFTFGEEF